jgi:hypothetical protein
VEGNLGIVKAWKAASFVRYISRFPWINTIILPQYGEIAPSSAWGERKSNKKFETYENDTYNVEAAQRWPV